MPRKPQKANYAERAKRIFLRGTAFSSPQAAMDAGARTEEEWLAVLEGQRYRLFFETGLKGRQKVKKRHPMRGKNVRKSDNAE